MSFGSFAAAVYFALFAVWFAVAGLGGGRAAAASALAVAIAAASLAVGLRGGAAWARWLAALAALAFGALALRRLMLGDDGVAAMLALLAAPLVASLLALPITGAPGRDAARAPHRRWPAWVATLAVIAALVAGWQQPPLSAGVARAAAGPSALPAAARSVAVDWYDLPGGIGLATRQGKPLLVTVETSWCPYCRKMQSVTWSAPDVARRLADVVPVRVDAEDGDHGSALAERFGVRGYPTQLLLGQDGTLIARADGFQNARQFLGWLDGALRDAGAR